MTLKANPNYWAGQPAIETIELVGDIGGRSPVEVFEDGDLDYTTIGGFDASWVAYDKDLGPQLVEVPSLSTEYYGFDVRQAPFDDVRVRQAFGDGHRLAPDRRARLARWGRLGRHLDGAVRHPRPERNGLPAGPRSRCGAGVAGRGRLSGRGRVPARDADDRWRVGRPGDHLPS